MAVFRIFIEDTVTSVRFKEFKAKNMAEAVRKAEADESWTEKDGWTESDGSNNCEIREELCEKVVKEDA